MRLPQMQLCPVFWVRAFTAFSAASAISAEGMTMNGSDPPSSSTIFLSCLPAVSATAEPAPSLPVSVAATTRWSSMMPFTASALTTRFWNNPSGAPASRITRSIISAQPIVTLACFRRPVLPAMIAGAMKRTACQSGKFHGMIASTGPIGK